MHGLGRIVVGLGRRETERAERSDSEQEPVDALHCAFHSS
jgi:hypothetical protein